MLQLVGKLEGTETLFTNSSICPSSLVHIVQNFQHGPGTIVHNSNPIAPRFQGLGPRVVIHVTVQNRSAKARYADVPVLLLYEDDMYKVEDKSHILKLSFKPCW